MKIITRVSCIIVFACLSFSSFAQQSSITELMKKAADWQLKYWDTAGMKYGKANWVYAAAYTGIMALNDASGDTTYRKALYAIGDSLQWRTGKRMFHADDYCIGQTYAKLYQVYQDPKIIEWFKMQADSIIAQPHTESLEMKNNIVEREWAWCDALFMGPTALAYLATATGQNKYLDIADKLWWKTTDYLLDSQENLYYRDSRFFTQKESNGSKVFWSRGNGWVMAGLVRMLENLPDDYPTKQKYVDLYKKMSEKIISLQSNDGTWHTALLDPDAYPSKETSGTGFYCYALAWGINHGLLPKDKYLPAVKKAWEALTNAIHPDGKLGFVQPIGDKPGATDYNTTEAYGVGAFLLAGSEMLKL